MMLGVVRRLVSQAFRQRLRPGPQAIQRRFASQAVNQMLKLQQMDMCAGPPSRGLVVGVFADETDRNDAGVLTAAGWRYNVQKTAGRLLEVLRMSGPMPKRGEARLFFAIEPERIPYYSVVAVVGLGKECLGYNPYEVLDEQKEAIRRSVAAACRILAELDTDRIEVESCGHAESTAEGAALGIWLYQELRNPQNRIPVRRWTYTQEKTSSATSKDGALVCSRQPPRT